MMWLGEFKKLLAICGYPQQYAANIRALAQSAVPASVTNTVQETVLATIPIPAGALGSNGAIRISAMWTGTSSSNGKVTRARLGGVSIWGVNLTNQGSEFALSVTANRNNVASQITTPTVGPGTSTNAFVLTSVDTSADVTLTLTGTLSNASETLTLESYCVEVITP